MTTTKKEFLTTTAVDLLGSLDENQAPAFGLMTPQHMVEHLTWVIKTSAIRRGEVENPPTKGQVSFKRFIAKGAILKHYPSDKTTADLPKLKYGSLAEAVSHYPEAIERLYTFFETNPDIKAYNRSIGELGFEEVELFTYQHVRYHLWQFGCLESYP